MALAVSSVLYACAYAAPRIAFQVYAVRDLCEKDFVGTLKAAKALGYEGVETGRLYGLGAKELKAACDEAGLGSARDKANWKRIVPALAADGVEWLVVKPTTHPSSLKDLAASIEYLKEVL